MNMYEQVFKNIGASTDEELESLAVELYKGVEDGEESAIEKEIERSRMDKFCSILKELGKERVVEELEAGGVANNGIVKIELFNVPVRLDYSEDEEWCKADKEEKAAKAKKRPIEQKKSMAYKNGVSLVDNDTGEVYSPAKYKSGGGTSWKISKVK